MDTELVKITKEFKKLENICKDNYLLNYGRCENGHFIPHYPGLIGDFLPSSDWYGSRKETLPMYLDALKKENMIELEKQTQNFKQTITQMPKLYLIINNQFKTQPNLFVPNLEIRYQ
jgi:hypothetical protein